MEIPEGFFNTRYIFRCDGVLDEMSFAIGGQAGPGVDASTIADQCSLAVSDSIIPTQEFINNAYTWVGTQTTRTIGGLPQVGEFNNNLAGTGVGDGVIVNSALLVRKNTSQGGRKNRGRCFVPPYAENNADVDAAGVVNTVHIAALQTLWDDFHAALVTRDCSPWLLHSDPVDEPTPITSFSVQQLLATQRRRMR